MGSEGPGPVRQGHKSQRQRTEPTNGKNHKGKEPQGQETQGPRTTERKTTQKGKGPWDEPTRSIAKKETMVLSWRFGATLGKPNALKSSPFYLQILSCRNLWNDYEGVMPRKFAYLQFSTTITYIDNGDQKKGHTACGSLN